jgi:ABC-2 type transport system permease protein
MSQVLILLRKSLLSFWRAKAAVAITFLVPIALIYLIGHVFGLYPSKNPGPSGIPLAVVNLSSEPAATKLVEALQNEKGLRIITEYQNSDGTKHPLTEADVRVAIKDNDYRFALILPADLLPENSFGVHMRFLTNPRSDIEAQMVNGLLQKTVFSHVPELLGQSLQKEARRYLGAPRLESFNRTLANAYGDFFKLDREAVFQRLNSADFGFGRLGQKPLPAAQPVDPSLRRLDTVATAPGTAPDTSPASSAATDVFSKIVKIETEQLAGKKVTNSMAARTVGGYAIMFLLMAVSGSAATLFEEKNTGIFQRLLSAPVRPAHILWARFFFGLILGLVQITVLFLAGRVFFGLEIFQHVGALFAVSLAAAAACSAFGMLVTAISPSAAAAQGISTLVVLSMSAVGGAWWPTSMMPDYIQRISKFTLVYWAVEGFTDVLWAGQSLLEVLPKVGILAAIAAGVLALALWCFNRGKLFD